jgi:hypothetical protein
MFDGDIQLVDMIYLKMDLQQQRNESQTKRRDEES